MFKFLKDKINSWTKKITESKAKEVEVEEKEIDLSKKHKIKEKKEQKHPKGKKSTKKEKKSKQKETKVKTGRVTKKDLEDAEKFIEEALPPIETPETIDEPIPGEAEIRKQAEIEVEEEEIKIAEKRPEDKEEREIGQKIWEDIETKAMKDSIRFPEAEKPKEEKKGFFSRFKEKFTTTKISEEEFSNYSEDLSMILLENNVAFEVAEKIIEDLKKKIVDQDIPKKYIEEEIKNSLKGTISEILLSPPDIIKMIKEKSDPLVFLFCGINGTGKTTTIAKIAHLLKKEKISSVIAAADTFRAASIEQLKTHGEKLGVKVIAHDYGSDPAAVGFEAIQYAKKNNIKVVLIDTAGRMHTAKNLLKEMEKIVKVCKPDLKLFVGESTTGNDSVEQVSSFNDAIGIDGIILSKADIDEKGGTALSVGYVTKKPIFFLGTGQEYNDIEIFNKKKFIEKLGL